MSVQSKITENQEALNSDPEVLVEGDTYLDEIVYEDNESHGEIFNMNVGEFFKLALTWDPVKQFSIKYSKGGVLTVEDGELIMLDTIKYIHGYLIRKNKYFCDLHIKRLFFVSFWQKVKLKYDNTILKLQSLSLEYRDELSSKDYSSDDDYQIDLNSFYGHLSYLQEKNVRKYLQECCKKLIVFSNSEKVSLSDKENKLSKGFRAEIMRRYGLNVLKKVKDKESEMIVVLVANNTLLKEIDNYIKLESKPQISMLRNNTDLNLVSEYRKIMYKKTLLDASEQLKDLGNIDDFLRSRKLTKKQFMTMISAI